MATEMLERSTSDKAKPAEKIAAVSLRSKIGLNAANFFLAEVVGVVLPFLNTFLKERGWEYGAIGIATAVAGLGVFVFQTPAGWWVDRISQRRTMLAASSIILGVSFGLL